MEPGGKSCNRLNTSITLNSFSHVTLVGKPVSNKIELVDVHINSDDRGGNDYGAVIIPWKYKEQSYPRIIRMTATTLDEELEELSV